MKQPLNCWSSWSRSLTNCVGRLPCRCLIACIAAFVGSITAGFPANTGAPTVSVSSVAAPNPASLVAAEGLSGPFDRQMADHVARLSDANDSVRARAAEALGFMRAYGAERALVLSLRDEATEVRRQAALALAWCGGRNSVAPLLEALDDDDWFVRQAAHVSLGNLTGMEFPFDALASAEERSVRARRWRGWWASAPSDGALPDVLELLEGTVSPVANVTVSTAYKGPADVLIDGAIGPEYWQTKNVKPPQWCLLDLGRSVELDGVTVHQYGRGYCMTGYELAVSLDGKVFTSVRSEKGLTPVELVIGFPRQQARYVRITSLGSENPNYPTTFFEIELHEAATSTRATGLDSARRLDQQEMAWRNERGARALGSLGGRGATEAILKHLGPSPPRQPALRPMVRAGIRALGRLRDDAGFTYLVQLLENPMWARCAAEALGDLGDRRAVPALSKAYGRYAKRLNGQDPIDVPADDKMTFPSEDRMLETPYWIAHALSRLPIDDPADRETMSRLAPLFMANLPGDHDTFILYEPEVGHLLTRHLLERSGLRQEACEQAFVSLGQPRRVPAATGHREWPVFPARRMATWLPAACVEKEDLPRLLALLEHPEHWVRLNAAKAIAWLGDRRAIEPLAALLQGAKAEADFGYSGTFKDEEYTDPAPRWREGLVRALGLLHAREHTSLIVKVLNDERSVLDIRRAAAQALADMGGPEAIAALEHATEHHDYFNVRRLAQDALRSLADRRSAPSDFRPRSNNVTSVSAPAVKADLPVASKGSTNRLAYGATTWDALVFIKGDNDVPNTPQTVEQADRWRQTYAVTDEGPTYRPGNNLYLLRPARPDGQVTPLTTFGDGYVAEPEISWDGRQVVFCHRTKSDPWWQIYIMNVDGTDLKKLTTGPYHSVGPVWLPDGRIVFASSRLGARDEYHGYLCTALCVMNANGTGLQQLAANIGRDNEPAVLADGRIAFSRLEVFYSRNKTELTLHAIHPDGTGDVVLYGPERRRFWRELNHGAPDPADVQESPWTHRVLRMTQPQPMPNGRDIIVCTQGGLTLVGWQRDSETLLCLDFKEYAYTTPYPLPDGRVLCSVTFKTPDRKKVDLGIYLFDPATGRRELVYNDPATADYEARPIMARNRPATELAADTSAVRGYSGRFLCASVFQSQEPEVRARGRLVRLVEGVPQVARHATQTTPDEVWKNHGGTLARVLGTAPLAADGSFFAEVPADRLLHLQVLDSDRRVVGNQLTWISPRPGETKSCVGCHEDPKSAPSLRPGLAARVPPVDFLPRGDEFRYRAKAWFKGSLPPEIEERTRTVRAVNLMGR